MVTETMLHCPLTELGSILPPRHLPLYSLLMRCYSALDWIGLEWIGTLILPGEAFSHEATLPGTQDTHTYTC